MAVFTISSPTNGFEVIWQRLQQTNALGVIPSTFTQIFPAVKVKMSFDVKLYQHLRFCIRCGEFFFWCSVCRNFQDLINIYSGIPSSSLWHLVWHLPDIPFWHLTSQLIWHRIWLTIHIVWPRSWHLISFLKILHANILRVIKSDETSDIWPDIPVGISSDILLWHTFWRLSLRRIWHAFWHHIWNSTCHIYPLASNQTFVLALLLTSCRTLSLR